MAAAAVAAAEPAAPAAEPVASPPSASTWLLAQEWTAKYPLPVPHPPIHTPYPLTHAEYDITALLVPFMDPHLVYPVLSYVGSLGVRCG